MSLDRSVETALKQQTELGQVMDNLDNDDGDKSNMSKIDFNSRLSATEVSGVLVLDELIGLGVLSDKINLGRRKKRLSVSLNGLGRQEKVEIVKGDREQKQGGGFMNKMGNLFKRQE